MSKKGRPAPLSDSIFRAKLEKEAAKQNLPCPIGPNAHVHEREEIPIPVHNTFIQFGSSTGLELQKQLSTAPAWIGPSLQSMIQGAIGRSPPRAAADDADAAEGGSEDADESKDSLPLKRYASPKKVPVMRYSLSASSARAAGVVSSGAVVASYEPCGGWSPETDRALGGLLSVQDPSTTQAGTDAAEDDLSMEGDVRREAAAAANLDDLPSMGSEKHAEGLCKRCCFFPKGRCLNAKDCEFCHLPHEKRKRKKKKKKKGAAQGEEDDSEDDDSDEEGGVAAVVSPERGRPGDSSVFGRSPGNEVWSSASPSSPGLSASQLTALESPLHARGIVQISPSSRGVAGSPKAEGATSMPSTASSVPNWPRPLYELESLYGYGSPLAGLDMYSPSQAAVVYATAAALRGLPPPPPVAAPGATSPGGSGHVETRLPLYPYPYGGVPGYPSVGVLPPQGSGGSSHAVLPMQLPAAALPSGADPRRDETRVEAASAKAPSAAERADRSRRESVPLQARMLGQPVCAESM
eukprot:CAMPEP_0183395486 /NCGR_PEP_ID=MMETSP0370-20130417/9348_1 /TAXON_ID=268820 /ORGANISM="Peridinium aciculiferum, Strain PAER-2" /LENGTH=521 /DNA_ID=CAMNT_0025576109 /DNA_START=127 /DNA_END=1694 /DNA_ORIENTATION=+